MNLPETAPQRSFRMRWWMWIIAVLLVLLSAAIAIRIQGFHTLQEMQRLLRDAGQPADPRAFAMAAPPVDTVRQDELRRILQRRMPWADEASRLWSSGDLREPRPDPAHAGRVAALLRAGTSDTGDLFTLMDRGPLLVSAFGWLPRDPAVLATMSAEQANTIYCPNLLTCRAMAHWLALSATTASDPAPALARLATWRSSMRRPAILIDSMIVIAIDRIADETHLWLAVRGRLPPAQLARWLAEPADQRSLSADGFAGDRCLFWEPYSRLGIDGGITSLAYSVSADWQAALLGIAAWPLQGHDCARGFAVLSEGERWLRGAGPMLPMPSGPFGIQGPLARIALPNTASITGIGWDGEIRHRLARAAGRIAAEARSGHDLPSAVALPGGALPDDPPLAYERLGPTRFRVGVDPTLALPAGVLSLPIGSDTGKPASRESARVLSHSIEIDLDAVLIPPPEKPAKVKATK